MTQEPMLLDQLVNEQKQTQRVKCRSVRKHDRKSITGRRVSRGPKSRKKSTGSDVVIEDR